VTSRQKFQIILVDSSYRSDDIFAIILLRVRVSQNLKTYSTYLIYFSAVIDQKTKSDKYIQVLIRSLATVLHTSCFSADKTLKYLGYSIALQKCKLCKFARREL